VDRIGEHTGHVLHVEIIGLLRMLLSNASIEMIGYVGGNEFM